MHKLRVTLLMIMAVAMVPIVPLHSQPVYVWLWDNDNGEMFMDPDLPYPSQNIGCQVNVLQSLGRLGYRVILSTEFQNPLSLGADAAFVTTGFKWPGGGQYPGLIFESQRHILEDFMLAGRPVIMDGSDLAYTYGFDQATQYDPVFLQMFFGTRYYLDSSPSVDSIHGRYGTMFEDLHMAYAPHNDQSTGPKSSVDQIDTVLADGMARPIFQTINDQKIAYCVGTSYSSYYKNPHNTFLLNFVFGACQDNLAKANSSNKDQLMRLIMGSIAQSSGNPIYPAAPDTLLLQLPSDTMVAHLRWWSHQDLRVTGYRLYRYPNGDLIPDLVKNLVGRTTKAYDDFDVYGGNLYIYKLTALALLTDTSTVPKESRFSNEVICSFPLSVTLSQFGAQTADGQVILNWTTESEENSNSWRIQRSMQGEGTFTNIGTLRAQGSSQRGHSYSFTDRTVAPATRYYYRLGEVSNSGAIAWFGPIPVTTQGRRAYRYSLSPARPNPCEGLAFINYSVPAAGPLELKVYDVSGRLVRTLAEGVAQPGDHTAEWHGDDNRGVRAANGIYVYRLTAGGMTITKRLTLVR